MLFDKKNCPPGHHLYSSMKLVPYISFKSVPRRRRINVAMIRRFRNGVQTLDHKVPEPIFPGLERGLIGRKPYLSGTQLCSAEERADKKAFDEGLMSYRTYLERIVARLKAKNER